MSRTSRRHMNIHALVAATLVLAAGVALAPAAGEAAPSAPTVTIRPVVQSVPGKPGRYVRKFQLSYRGPKKVHVSMKVEELDVITGKVLEAPQNAARQWVTLDRREVTLRRGARRTARAAVRVPRWHGQHRRRIGV